MHFSERGKTQFAAEGWSVLPNHGKMIVAKSLAILALLVSPAESAQVVTLLRLNSFRGIWSVLRNVCKCRERKTLGKMRLALGRRVK
jgi:hypothetical protein